MFVNECNETLDEAAGWVDDRLEGKNIVILS